MARASRPVRIGAVEADLDGVDLRDVCVAGREVVDRLYVALRDEAWATRPARVDVVEESRDETRLRLVWDADHEPSGAPLSWRGTLHVDESGLSLAVDATAHGPITYNRFGICVLHPLGQRGGRVVMRPAPGFVVCGADRPVLPVEVAPQHLGETGPVPALGPFTGIDLTAEGLCVAWSFEGDAFEMEDQRNWGDPSFKTYSTPLALPRPHRLDAGERIVQVVRATWEAAPEHLPPAPGRRPAVGGSRRAVRPGERMDIGALVPGGRGLSGEEAGLLLDRVGVTFLRLEHRLGGGADPRRPAAAAAVARAAGMEVDLAVLLQDGWGDDELVSLVGATTPRTLWLFAADARSGAASECTSPDDVARARALLGPTTRVGGGTLFNFCELHRHRLDHLDDLTFALCPTVHAADERSILQTPASVPDIVATARRLRPEATLEVGPLVSAERVPRLAGAAADEPGLDPGVLPPGWLGDVLRSLEESGADRACTLTVDALVAGGVLTAWGDAISGYAARTGRSGSNSPGGAL